jgi:GTP-binding protein Era
MTKFKSGFVSIVGRPNVGKSTLLNHILETKLAITSSTAQTTRNTIQGIYTDDEAQIIFMDTPGIHKPQDGLGSFMNTTALNSIYGVDVVLFIAPADEKIGRGDKYIVERLKEADGPVYLILNKIDLLSKDELIKKLTEWKELYDFKEIIPISAISGDNVDTLIKIVKNELKEGIMYYPKDHITDHPERFIMAEFIREKILYFTREEVPHSVAIVIEKMEEDETGVHIMAAIVVDRQSQKGIIIGKQGSMIKKIRENARREMKRFLQTPVTLELFVKVENNWRNKQKYLREFGYDENDY